jgi:hypothetical protein
MLGFLYDESGSNDWDDDFDHAWRQEWHTVVVGILTTIVLGLWLLNSMGHPPRPALPAWHVVPVDAQLHPYSEEGHYYDPSRTRR